MSDECMNALDQIETDAAKIQAICKLAIDPVDAKTDPDVQTILYIISDYADNIKQTSSDILM